MDNESKTNPGKNAASAQGKKNSSTKTQFSEHVLLQRKGRAQTLASNIKDLLDLRGVKLAGEASGDHILRGVAHFEEHHNRSQVFSLGVHGGLGLVIFLAIVLQLPPSINPLNRPIGIFQPAPSEIRRATQQTLIDPGKGHGGGGDQDPRPVTGGQLPRITTREQIVPPSVIRNQNPIYQEIPSIVGPDQFQKFDPSKVWGDPSSPYNNGSNGPGTGPGMGSDKGRGIGPRGGPGYGNDPENGVGHIYRDGEGARSPECSYCPRPDYSDEARKAKYQGSVVLSVVVLPDGKASRIEVLTSPGMGLDEKAIEAVRNWRFKPGLGPNGKPAAISVTIEVVFQLF